MGRQTTAISDISTALQAVGAPYKGRLSDAVRGLRGGRRKRGYSYSSVLKFVSPACPSKDVLMLIITGLRHRTHNFEFMKFS